MLLKTKPLTVAVWRVLGIAGGAGLFLLTSELSAAEVQPVSAPAAEDAAPVSDGKDRKQVNLRRLDTVVVTAQRRKENPQQVASAISAISGSKLQDDGVGRAANDVIKYVPNATAATSGGHTRPRWWIRGVGTGTQGLDSPSPVGIYLDDVYISNATATAFPVFDLERVEVLRGPQGTLWGKNTTGGAVNLVSKRPSFKSDGYGKIDVGSGGLTILEGAAGGTVIDDKLAARASFHSESSDGKYENAFTGEKGVGIKDTALRLQFLAPLGDNGEALLNVHKREYTGDGSNATTIGRGAGGAYWNAGGKTYVPSTDRYAVSTNAANRTEIEQNGVALNLKWRLRDLELTSITAYEDFTQDALTDSDYTPIELSRGFTDASSDQISQEFRLASPKQSWGNWVAGTHYFKENIQSNAATGTLPTGQLPTGRATPYSNTLFEHDTESYALFGSLTFNVTDALSVTGGLRWSTEKKDIDFRRYAVGNATYTDQSAWWRKSSVANYPAAPSATQVDSNRWSDFTYDFTPIYRLTEHQRVYFKYAKGFRGGGYNTGATNQAGINVLEPEYLTSYELGYKSEWLDGRLNFNANVFHYNYEDIQINAVVPSPTGANSQLRNAAQGKANGAEFELDALVASNLRFRAGLGLLDTEFEDFKDAGGDYSGNQFVRSPKVSGVAGIEYRVPLDSGNDVVLGTDWNYYARQFFYTNNQTNPDLAQDAYALGSARASYITANNKLNVTAYVNNVADERYKQHTLPGTTGATGSTVFWGEGRTAGLSVTTRW